MEKTFCGECKNHYKRGGWHCWSGNKSLGFCNQNGTPHPKAKHWNYNYKRGKAVEYKDIERIENRRADSSIRDWTVFAATEKGKRMTNLEAAALISKLYAENSRYELSAVNKYAEAVALAIMALKEKETNDENN